MVTYEEALKRVMPKAADHFMGSTQHSPKGTQSFVGRSVSPTAACGLLKELRLIGEMPEWAVKLNLRDARGTLPWDSD
jgi:hypothetical protein